VKRDVALAAGEYVPEFKSEWKLPNVDDVTPVRLVRQFSLNGETGYRKVDEAKLFPAFQPVDLAAKKIAVVGDELQKIFGGPGVPASNARIIIAKSFDPAWKKQVTAGVRVLVQSAGGKPGEKQLGHYNLVSKGVNKGFTGPIKNFTLPEGMTLNFGTPGQERFALTDKSFNIENPAMGAWVTIGFAGTMDFSQTAFVQLGYGLWTRPAEKGAAGYVKSWENAGGAPFFRKTVRLLLSDDSGQWFVCEEKEAGVMTREFPTALRGTLAFDCLQLSWKPVRLESDKVVALNEAIQPDFSRVSACGMLFGETNPGSPVQINSIELRGGARPGATVQPGGVFHRLLNGLGQEDFSFWRGGSSSQTLALPKGANVRRILLGNKDGAGSALQETFIGRGVVLESVLNAGNLQEPAAGFLLNRMVDYLTQYEPAEAAGSVAVPGGGALADWLSGLGADLVDESRLIAIDARDAVQMAASKQSLIDNLKKGGTVLFSEVTPETIEAVREICGQPLRLTEPYFGQRYKCIKAPVSWARVGSPHEWVDYYEGVLAPYPFEPNFSPLLAGVANLDLDWKRTDMFRQGIEVQGMNPVSASADHQILISNWHIGSETPDNLYGENLNGVRDLRQNSWFVNRDPVVLELKARNGRVVISQLDLEAGGEKAKRLMQTMLTNLGVSFGGAAPAPADVVYDSKLRKDQLARFALYDTQIDPVTRQYYGVPDPMPDYLKETRIYVAAGKDKMPLFGFFGDSLTLGLSKPLEAKLADVVQMDTPVTLAKSGQAADELRKQIGAKKYARIVFSMGESDLDTPQSADDFRSNLEAAWKVLAEHSKKIYWVPVPSAFGKDEQRAARGRELNRIAEEFFEGKDVYKIPFVYADTDKLPQGFFSGNSERFTPAEAESLAKRLAEAVISFGAQ
jgi:hypothetical protein